MPPYDQVLSPYDDELERLQKEIAAARAKSAELNAQVNAPDETAWQDTVAQALLTLGPAAFGAAIAGKEGGIAGFEAGLSGGDRFLASVKEEQDRRRALASSDKQLADLELKGLEQQQRGLQGKLTDKESALALRDIEEQDKQLPPEVIEILGKLSEGKGYALTSADRLALSKAGVSATEIARYSELGQKKAKGSAEDSEEVSAAKLAFIKGEATPEQRLLLDKTGSLSLRDSAWLANADKNVGLGEQKQALNEQNRLDRLTQKENERYVAGFTDLARTKDDAKELKDKTAPIAEIHQLLDLLEQSVIRGGDAVTGEEAVKQRAFMGQLIKSIKEKDNYGAAFTLMEASLAASGLPVLMQNPLTEDSFFNSISVWTRAQKEGALGRDPLVALQTARELMDAEMINAAAARGMVPSEDAPFIRSDRGRQMLLEVRDRLESDDTLQGLKRGMLSEAMTNTGLGTIKTKADQEAGVTGRQETTSGMPVRNDYASAEEYKNALKAYIASRRGG